MRKLLLKFLLILPILFFLLISSIILPPNKSIKNTNLFALPVKDSLLENTDSPRIIFIGGSNLSFGLNCQLIKDSLHLNPINTGIHAGIGLKFMLTNSLKYIRDSDIVILSPEYEQFYGDIADGNIVLLSVIIDVLHSSKDCDNIQLIKLMRYVPEYAAAKLKLWNYYKKVDTTNVGIVDKNSFNCYGDAYIHWSMLKPTNVQPTHISGKFNSELLPILKEFELQVHSKNAHIFITFPGFQKTAYDMNISKIKEIEVRLKENGFYLLDSPERFSIADSLIFNTSYHLTKKGTDYRTSLLIEDLKKADLLNSKSRHF
jgi:hypothetical protein